MSGWSGRCPSCGVREGNKNFRGGAFSVPPATVLQLIAPLPPNSQTLAQSYHQWRLCRPCYNLHRFAALHGVLWARKEAEKLKLPQPYDTPQRTNLPAPPLRLSPPSPPPPASRASDDASPSPAPPSPPSSPTPAPRVDTPPPARRSRRQRHPAAAPSSPPPPPTPSSPPPLPTPDSSSSPAPLPPAPAPSTRRTRGGKRKPSDVPQPPRTRHQTASAPPPPPTSSPPQSSASRGEQLGVWDRAVDWDDVFAGRYDDSEASLLSDVLVASPIREWLDALQGAVHAVVKHDWAHWEQAKAAQAAVFVRPPEEKEGVALKNPALSRPRAGPTLQLLQQLLTPDRYIEPRDSSSCEGWDPQSLTAPQSYLHSALALQWQQGTEQLKEALKKKRKNRETSKVGDTERIKYRVEELGWTTGRWNAEVLPWVSKETRTEAAQSELLEQFEQLPPEEREHQWDAQLAPMVSHFNGREHLVIATTGGMGTTSHSDGVGGWGYLGEGWKVLITCDVLDRDALGWDSQEELLELPRLLACRSVKWSLLGPDMSMWFTPDSHHAVITLCRSTYVTWSATMSPHRVLYNLGLILTAQVEDYTWVAMGAGRRNHSDVYVNIMRMVVYLWDALLQKVEVSKDGGKWLAAVIVAHRGLRDELEELFGEQDKVYHPLKGQSIGGRGSEMIRILYQHYADAMRLLESRYSGKESLA